MRLSTLRASGSAASTAAGTLPLKAPGKGPVAVLAIAQDLEPGGV